VLVKVSWLGELASVFWWVELDHFSLECSEVSSSEFWGVKVSWLGELASVFWWVELDHFSLECSEVSSSEFWAVENT